MFRKLLLCISTFGIVCIAFAIYVWQDPSVERPQPGRTATLPSAVRTPTATTQPADGSRATLRYDWANIPAGQAPQVRVYDPRTGQARIAFQARQWDPVSDTEFHLVEPSARVLLPGGQLAYVRADEGQVRVQSGDNRNLIPQRGSFKGRVQIFIDRTSPEQRRENPRWAQPELHPEAVVKIWLDDARFDLDLDHLESDGPVLVQSAQGSIEGTGLRLVWSETDRQLQYLRILQGKRAVIRGAGLAEAGPLPGSFDFVVDSEEVSETDSQVENGSPSPDTAHAQVLPEQGQGSERPALAVEPEADHFDAMAGHPDAMAGYDEAAPRQSILLLDPDQPMPVPMKDRVDTYNVQFSGDILARQREGIRVTGSLAANVLTLMADFGREERKAVEYQPADGTRVPATQPQRADTQPATQSAVDVAALPTTPRPRSEVDSETYIELLWTGDLVIRPEASNRDDAIAETDSQDEPSPRKRFHLIAEGEPVRMEDARRGTVTCARLEYHLEAQQGWLTASTGHPVVMAAGPDRQLIAEEELFFDQQGGVARITGPGRLVRLDDVQGPSLADASPTRAAETSGLAALGDADRAGDVSIAWQRSGRIDFALAEVPEPDTDNDLVARRRSTPYLSEAAFEGDVRIDLPERAVSADAIQVAFMAPNPERPDRSTMRDNADDTRRESLLDGPLVAERIVATGQVHMERQTTAAPALGAERSSERFTCNRLEIDMTVNDVGENVPRQFRAYDEVVAWQEMQRYLGPLPTGPADVREIRAKEVLTVDLASLPRAYTDAQRAEFEAALRQHGLSPDSDEWARQETAFLEKRDIVPTRMEAVGQVFARDTRQNLFSLEGERIECSFTRENTIDHALIVGQRAHPAQVVHEDFEIRGEQIALDMITESVRVPGEGLLRFYTEQDLDGRRVDQPIPVAVTWDNQMWLRGYEQTGTFQGQVRVVSENNVLESNELRLRFEPTEAHAAATDHASRSGGRSLLRTLRGADTEKPAERADRGMRLRLTRVDAFGDARILSSTYAQEHGGGTGRFSRAIRELVPAALRPPREPGDDGADDEVTQPLESRIRLIGRHIRMDLVEEQLIVEGSGNLLIEDYRLPTGTDTQARAAGRTSPFMEGSALPGIEGIGPSQTLFEWQSSMAFLNKENKATFHNNVVMRHRAGADMVLAGQLRSALQLDDATVRHLRTQTASLTCNELVAEFERDAASRDSGSSPLSRATRLKAFWARDQVALVYREPTVERTAYGTFISYDNTSGIARIEGTPSRPNIIQEIDPATRRLKAQRQGGTLEWNMRTNVITAKGSVILAPGG